MAGGADSRSVPLSLHISHYLYYLVGRDIQGDYGSILSILDEIKSELDCADSFSSRTFYSY